MTKRKQRVLKIIRKSVLTGKAVWVSHERSYMAEWAAYRNACKMEIERMRQWGNVVNRRRRNIMQLLTRLTASLPILGDIPPEKREAARFIQQLADKEPSKQSDFYDHICEERRLKRNAKRREKRWKEKYGGQNTESTENTENNNYDK